MFSPSVLSGTEGFLLGERTMEQDICLRCGGNMMHIGRERIQMGKFGILTGWLDQLISGALTVDIYRCARCGKLEFYAPDVPEEDCIAQTACPECGKMHDMDDARCPFCGKRLQ